MIVYFDKSANQNLGGQKLKIFVLTMLICASSIAIAGGDSAEAKVKIFQRQSAEIAQVEIEWVNESGFIADNKETKLKLHLHQWPDNSFFVKYILTIFYDPYEKKFPKRKFNECLKFLEEKSETKEIFNLGQMGTVHFRKDKDNPNQIIVPFAEVVKQHDGSTACYLYAAPT